MIGLLALLALLVAGCTPAEPCPVADADVVEVDYETLGGGAVCHNATEVTVRHDGSVDCAWWCADNGDDGVAFWGLSFDRNGELMELVETVTGDCI